MTLLGQPVVRTLTVTVNGTPTDATSVVFTVRSPGGVETTPANARTGVGTYEATFTPDTAGVWRYRWVTTGAGAGASEGSVTVEAPFTTLTVDVTPTDVADLLAQRILTQDGNPGGTFSSTTVPTDEQVQRLIDKVAAEEVGGLGELPTTLHPMRNSLVALAAAVRVLGVFFSGDAARDDLDTDLASLRDRFRMAVDTIATTGDPTAVSAEGSGGTGAGGAERPPPPAFSFPTTRPADVYLFGTPVTTLTERY